ncbi:MAG: hypothetical protein ACPKPY_07610 [Nitrososphaeraceae archaeon]
MFRVVGQVRTFPEWYNSIPEYIKKETRKKNNGKIYEINRILKKLEESDLKDKKPTIEEIKYWIHTNQI